MTELRDDLFGMIETPTRGARERSNTWTASPIKARAVRITAFFAPIALSWTAVRVLSPRFVRPESTVWWIAQALLVAVAVALGTQRIARRVLPLAFLLSQSLVFPDAAPSRFGAALRANNLGRLDRRIEEILASPGDRSEQQAAVEALSLVAALSRHDRLTRGHTERVRAYADLIAAEMGLSEQERSQLSWGVLLHDIGKLTVPEEVLNKTTPLTSEEWELLRQHPARSGEFLGPLEGWLGEWGRAAAEHHERWDGNGYPAGLAGTDISLAGRITAVADAYDVITSVRSYTTSMSADAARQELVRCAGTQFDPKVVRAMLQVSLGRQRNFGLWSWVTEVPTVARLLGTAGGATSGAAIAVAASLATIVVPTDDLSPRVEPPASVAFADSIETPPLEPDEGIVADASDDDEADPAPTTSQASRVPDGPTTTVSTAPTTSTSASPSTSTTTSTPSTTTAPGSTTPSTTTTEASAPTTTATSTTTTTIAPTTTTTTEADPPTASLTLFLTNPGGATNTNAHAVLPLETGQPTSAGVGNFDRDRNDEPGITIKKDGGGFNTGDSEKMQVWEFEFSQSADVDGAVLLDLYVAAKDFDTSKMLGASAQLRLCKPSCSTLATTTWSSDNPSASWTRAVLSFGSLTETMSTGDVLQLRVIAPDDLADDDMMFAYDSLAAPAVLRLG